MTNIVARNRVYARHDNAPRQNRAFGKAPFARSRMVNERAAWEGEYPGKTKNSEYEKPRTVCKANARGLIRSVNFGLPRIRIIKRRTKLTQSV